MSRGLLNRRDHFRLDPKDLSTDAHLGFRIPWTVVATTDDPADGLGLTWALDLETRAKDLHLLALTCTDV